MSDEKPKCPVDCGDSSCLCASGHNGMRTNGGCQCFDPAHDYKENLAMARRARLAVAFWRKRARDVIEACEVVVATAHGNRHGLTTEEVLEAQLMAARECARVLGAEAVRSLLKAHGHDMDGP